MAKLFETELSLAEDAAVMKRDGFIISQARMQLGINEREARVTPQRFDKQLLLVDRAAIVQ